MKPCLLTETEQDYSPVTASRGSRGPPVGEMTMMRKSRAALIVEDQPFVGMVASDILREAGFETFCAFDSADADRQLRDHPEIQLVIVEESLGGGTGGELAARIAASRPDLQLLVALERGREPAAELPARAQLLRKPFASGELRSLADVGEFA